MSRSRRVPPVRRVRALAVATLLAAVASQPGGAAESGWFPSFDAYDDLFSAPVRGGAQPEASDGWRRLPGPLDVPPVIPQQAGPGVSVAAPPVPTDPEAPAGPTVEERVAAALEGAEVPAGAPAAAPGGPAADAVPAEDPLVGVPSLAEAAYGAYQRGWYRLARRAATGAAAGEDAHPAAIALLGVLAENGLGMKADREAALGWYALAAEAGHAPAMRHLALLFAQGEGVDADPARAADLFERAAALGDAEAAFHAGLAYLDGAERERSAKIAARYMEEAAGAGHGEAAYALALMHRNGEGVPRSEEEATRWLARAAAAGDEAAVVEYAIALFNGRGTEADEATAATLFREAAEGGNPVAMNRYARLLAYGRGVEPDPEAAVKWHLVARARGVSDLWLDGFAASLPEPVYRAAEARAAPLVEE